MKKMLFILGLPRCGTTTLVNILSQHPDVYRAPLKEPHFFLTGLSEKKYFAYEGNEKIDACDLGFLTKEEDYAKNYGGFKDGRLYIDGSTLYSIHRGTIERIFLWSRENSIAPKFIIFRRNPFDRALSHYLFSRSRNEEPRDFMQALEEELSDSGQEKYRWILNGYFAGSYEGAAVNDVNKYFSMEHLLIIDIDTFDLRNKRNIDEICDFLNLSQFDKVPNVYENASVSVDSPMLNSVRVRLKTIRAKKPLLFDNRMTRFLFEKMMSTFGRKVNKNAYEHIRGFYMNSYRHLYPEHYLHGSRNGMNSE